jgi:uncharacterized repeat protein (TIGR03803 family)
MLRSKGEMPMSRLRKFSTALLVGLAMTAQFDLAGAGPFSVVHAFTGPDGESPLGPLSWGPNGFLYGTAALGGASDGGTFFRVDPTTNALTTFYNFTGGSDGGGPAGPVVFDTEGIAWGTTIGGGAYGCGTIFGIRVWRPPYIESVAHTFNGSDGCGPWGGLVWDNTRTNLYGTTQSGGGAGLGAVFRFSPSSGYTVLHEFTGADGAYPVAPLWSDSTGNFYGATLMGGKANSGTIFKITSAGTETILYSFCSELNCSNGADGQGGVVGDAAGNLYGVAGEGGQFGYGTVFKLAPNGKQTVLYAFTGGSDGAFPFGGLFRDSSGNLFGTAWHGGKACNGADNATGVVFRLYPNGKYSVLHAFTGGADGSQPQGPLGAQMGDTLYGTTFGEGYCHDGGSLFSISY